MQRPSLCAAADADR